MKHQENIARFLSTHTIYNKLLVHEMGTGKNMRCKLLLLWNNSKTKIMVSKELYIAKGQTLVNNFVNELVYKCTDGRYIQENEDDEEEEDVLEEKNNKSKKINSRFLQNKHI